MQVIFTWFRDAGSSEAIIMRGGGIQGMRQRVSTDEHFIEFIELCSKKKHWGVFFCKIDHISKEKTSNHNF